MTVWWYTSKHTTKLYGTKTVWWRKKKHTHYVLCAPTSITPGGWWWWCVYTCIRVYEMKCTSISHSFLERKTLFCDSLQCFFIHYIGRKTPSWIFHFHEMYRVLCNIPNKNYNVTSIALRTYTMGCCLLFEMDFLLSFTFIRKMFNTTTFSWQWDAGNASLFLIYLFIFKFI